MLCCPQVVSEDELPSSKKESKESRKRKPNEEGDGYDPGSPTSETETANKKQAVAKVVINQSIKQLDDLCGDHNRTALSIWRSVLGSIPSACKYLYL